MRARIAPLLLALAATPAAAAGPAPGQLASFGDWVVGCDNLRGCTTLGLAPGDGVGAYVAIHRRGAAGDAPRVTLNLLAPDAPDAPELEAEIVGAGAPLLARAYPAEANGSYLTAAAGGEPAAGLIEALRRGYHLDLRLPGGPPQRMSLRGSAAALKHVDGVQGRTGTASALADPGGASAAAVPPPPEAPAVPRLPMKALPAAAAPAHLPASGDESCRGIGPLAFALTDGSTLWGLCDFAGAYNAAFRFWIAGPSGTRPASFHVPGRSGDPAVLTNPRLAPDGLGLAALALGRGLGDCGTSGDWAWTGNGFALVQFREMQPCRGVLPDDWPVLYRAG